MFEDGEDLEEQNINAVDYIKNTLSTLVELDGIFSQDALDQIADQLSKLEDFLLR